MYRAIRYLCVIAVLFSSISAFSQVEVVEDLVVETELKLFRQNAFFGQIHSGGFGFGYRYGKIKSITRNTFQEFEFLKDKHPKAEKRPGMNSAGLSRRYIYGGLNQLYVLRYGFGIQRILNEKPYWGGLQVDCIFAGGAALGLAVPQYLHIRYPDPHNSAAGVEAYYRENERYDENNPMHNDWQYIDGAGKLFSGVWHLRPYPGVYARFGFNFDFGKYQEKVNSIEVGAMIDVFPIPVPMMAFSDRNFFFANFYLAYHFGKRK